MRFRNKKCDPAELDAYGTFVTEEVNAAKPLSFYEKNIVGYVATALFVLIDTMCLYTVWNTVQTANYILVYLLAIGCAVCLDVPMAVCALAVKKCEQKLVSRRHAEVVTVLSIATFLITFAFALWFRLETKDLTFKIGASGNMKNALEASGTTDEHGGAVFVAALFNAVIPASTSLASFVISYFSFNPLGKLIEQYTIKKIRLEARLTECKIILNEVKRAEDYKSFLLSRERDLFNQYVNSCRTMRDMRKQSFGLAQAEITGSADGVTVITDSRSKIPEKYDSSAYEKAAEAVGRSKASGGASNKPGDGGQYGKTDLSELMINNGKAV